MFEIGKTYWLKIKATDGERYFNVKIRVTEENAFMVKGEVGHGVNNPDTIDIIPFTRIVDVQSA